MMKVLAGTATELLAFVHGVDKEFLRTNPEANLGSCRSCGEPVLWGKLKDRPHPFNLDGTSHFSTCEQAEQWRQRNKNQMDMF